MSRIQAAEVRVACPGGHLRSGRGGACGPVTEIVTLKVRASRRQGVPFSTLPSSRMWASRSLVRASLDAEQGDIGRRDAVGSRADHDVPVALRIQILHLLREAIGGYRAPDPSRIKTSGEASVVVRAGRARPCDEPLRRQRVRVRPGPEGGWGGPSSAGVGHRWRDAVIAQRSGA